MSIGILSRQYLTRGASPKWSRTRFSPNERPGRCDREGQRKNQKEEHEAEHDSADADRDGNRPKIPAKGRRQDEARESSYRHPGKQRPKRKLRC